MLLERHIQTENLILASEVLGAAFVLYAIGTVVYYRFFHPYKDVPGPFLASITTLWYWRSVRYGISKNTHWPIHRRYGPIVRLAPNMVSIADPSAIETVFGAKNIFQKTPFYDGFNPSISPRRDGFCDRDERHHAKRTKFIRPLYSQQVILSFEPRFDRVIQLFREKMELFSQTGETFDMSTWLTKYTFDIIGELFYGREGGFGMIRDDVDYNGWVELMRVMPAPASAVTYVPWGFQTLYMASQLIYKKSRKGVRGFFMVITQAHAAVQQRAEEMKDPDYKPDSDVLSKMFHAMNDGGRDGVVWQLPDITVETWMTIWAGSDTTAIALSSIFWHLHRHPRVLKKLLEEIENAFETGALTYPVRFNAAIKLKYLWAVVQESMRIHASLGTGLPRIVPKGGVEMCGRFFPAGCHVIMTAMVVQFDKAVFGEDCHEFVPERWLRDGEQKAAQMERSMLQFGHGPRVCQGRHVTNTEMYKLLPTILRDFKFELETVDWEPFAGWFHHPKEINVRVSRRDRGGSLKTQG